MTPDNDWYYEQISEAILEVVEQGEKYQVFRLRKYPDRTMMSTLFIFGPGVICITGDLRVSKNGINIIGYGLDWFAMRLDGSYLAEKCLDRVWESDRARKDLDDYIQVRFDDAKANRDRDEIKHLKDLRQLIKDEGDWMFDSEEQFFNELTRISPNYFSDRGFGYGYPTAELGWLSAIQRRFSEEYRRLFPKQEAQHE